MVEIYFRTRKLKKACSEEKEIKKRLGEELSKKLQQRMMELQAAGSLADISYIPPARCHELSGNRAGQFSVDLKHPYRLLFIPTVTPVPRMKDGGIDRTRITSIEIIDIIDTH